MEPPLISQPASTRLPPGSRCSQTGRGSPQAPINRHAPLILNRQGSHDKLTIGQRQSLFKLNVIAIPNGYLRHVPAPTAPGPVCADAKPAPETLCSPSASVTPLAFVGPARHRRGRRFLPRQGLGVFRHAWVSEKRSQTL